LTRRRECKTLRLGRTRGGASGRRRGEPGRC
jgi:hypothetical protein